LTKYDRKSGKKIPVYDQHYRMISTIGALKYHDLKEWYHCPARLND
jgi:hypothetical protein